MNPVLVVVLVALVAIAAMVLVGGWTWNPWSKEAVTRTFTDGRGSLLLLGAIAGVVVVLIGLAASIPVLAVAGAATFGFFGAKYWRRLRRR